MSYAMYDDMPALVPANPSGAPASGFPPEAITPGGFGAGTPHAGTSRLAARFNTPAAGHSRLAHDDFGFSYPKPEFGSAPEPSIFEHNPWLAEKYGHPGFHQQPHASGRPYPGTPYHPAAAAPSMGMGDADWPQHGRDFGVGPNFDMGGGGHDGGGFGAGGFGPQHFGGGFGAAPPDEDETDPVISPFPPGMGQRPKSSLSHRRAHSHSPGYGASAFSDFGQLPPPQGFGQTPPTGQLTLTPGYDVYRRHNLSAGSTPHTTPLPLSAHPGYASGPRHQYKRPGDWRKDFAMPRKVGMSEKLGLNRVLSIGKVFQGEAKAAPHRTLDGSNAASPACIWDVRLPPSTLHLPNGSALQYLELQEAAFSMAPKNGRIILVHELLPWSLTLTVGATPYGTSTVVTVGHLLQTIHQELHRQIFESDFWNEAVGEGDRARIHRAWSTRCSVLADVAAGEEQSREREAKCREIAAEGVKRVDFLGDRTLFYGLKRRPVPGGGEVWEMRFRQVEV